MSPSPTKWPGPKSSDLFIWIYSCSTIGARKRSKLFWQTCTHGLCCDIGPFSAGKKGGFIPFFTCAVAISKETSSYYSIEGPQGRCQEL
jgi:hypothetical protein